MAGEDLLNIIPELKKTIEYIATIVASGVIGNRFDSWFVHLYYHQKQRLISWLHEWQLTNDDKQIIESTEEMKVLFSHVTSNVANEMFEQKLLLWPSITESLLRNKHFEFSEKQYFINLFSKLEPFTIHFLAKLEFEGPIDYNRVFPKDSGYIPPLGNPDLSLYLGQLQSSTAGVTQLYNDTENAKSYIRITPLGSHFMEFISNSSKEKIEQLSRE